jgi:hypothetical protein
MQSITAKLLAQHSSELLPACDGILNNVLVGDNFDVLPDPVLQQVRNSIYDARSIKHSSVELLQFPPGARLFGGRNFLVETAGKLVAEQVPPLHILSAEALAALSIRPLENVTFIEQPCVMVSRYGVMVWGHWIGELLPRILLTERMFPGIYTYVLPQDVVNITAPRNVFNSILETILLLGIPKDRILAARYDRDYVFRNLHFVTKVITNWAFHPGFLEQIRSAYLHTEQPISSAHRRIALLRTESKARNITNLNQIVDVLNKYDFEFVEVGKLPFQEQVFLFSTADIVVGVLASGLSGLFFLPNNKRVLSVGPEGFINKFFYPIIQSRLASYYDLRGNITNIDPRAMHFSDFKIDPLQLEIGIKKLDIMPRDTMSNNKVCEVFSKKITDPNDVNLLVAITFYYREDRIQFLLDTLLSYAEFQIKLLRVIILTNTDNEDNLQKLQRLLNILSTERYIFELQSFTEVNQSKNKFLLTWSHKKLISEIFMAKNSTYTHFLYAEDDIQVSFDNFLYYLKYKPQLAKYGLIPSFVRVEFNHAHKFLFLNDQLDKTPLEGQASVTLDNYTFRNMWWPYCAMFILDRGLAEEYIISDAFVMEKSELLNSGWGLPERAAMGLCFVNIPKGFRFRHVVPVDQSKYIPARECWIRHLPNNFTNSPQRALGKIALDQTFIRP